MMGDLNGVLLTEHATISPFPCGRNVMREIIVARCMTQRNDLRSIATRAKTKTYSISTLHLQGTNPRIMARVNDQEDRENISNWDSFAQCPQGLPLTLDRATGPHSCVCSAFGASKCSHLRTKHVSCCRQATVAERLEWRQANKTGSCPDQEAEGEMSESSLGQL